MARKIKKEKSKRGYFGEFLTDSEIKKHAVKSNFGTQDLDEIYQKELAGHIVNFFIKWSAKLEIPEDMMKNLSIIKDESKNYWAKYDPREKLWKFNLKMKVLPVDIIDYLVLEVLTHYRMIYSNVEFEAVMQENMIDYLERLKRLEEIEVLEDKEMTEK